MSKELYNSEVVVQLHPLRNSILSKKYPFDTIFVHVAHTNDLQENNMSIKIPADLEFLVPYSQFKLAKILPDSEHEIDGICVLRESFIHLN